MKYGNSRLMFLAFCLAVNTCSSAPAGATPPEKLVVTALPERKIAQLPNGPLYWRLENFPTLSQAQSVAGASSLAAGVAGKAWLFTLGEKGRSTPGGSKIAEVGPVPAFSAPEYLLRINTGKGPFAAT